MAVEDGEKIGISPEGYGMRGCEARMTLMSLSNLRGRLIGTN